MRKLFILIALLIFAFPAYSTEVFRVSEYASQDDILDPMNFNFSVADLAIHITNHGIATVTFPDDSVKKFQLFLDDEDYVEQVAYIKIEDNIVFVYGVTNYDSGAGKVSMVDLETLKPKWVAHIPGFNVGVAVAKDSSLYVTAISFVGKIDLATGQYKWKHENLYKKGPGVFNSFITPVIEGEVVRFIESQTKFRKTDQPVAIVVRDATGEILAPQF